jgi:hypothetical protein
MGLSQADLGAQLTAIQTAITAALLNPGGMWRVGQVEFDQSRYLDYLRQLQNDVIKLMRSEPSESYDTVQNAIGPLGHDATEFIDENF